MTARANTAKRLNGIALPVARTISEAAPYVSAVRRRDHRATEGEGGEEDDDDGGVYTWEG